MAKKLSIILGIIFVIVGILGFINNPLIGNEGYFLTDTTHDIVHIVIGLILIAFAKATTILVIGIVYLVLAILGFIGVGAEDTLVGVVAANHADHWLHVVLGVVMIVLGLATKGSAAPAPMAQQMPPRV